MTGISTLDRFKGAMVGVHVGDSIGAPYETWGPKKIAKDIQARGGLKFFDYPNPWAKDLGPKTMPAGRPTDDSDQTADLAYSLLKCGGLDVSHLREALRRSVLDHKSRLWNGVATGAGGTTRKALSDDQDKVEEALNNNIGTNGSLMRCMPLALWLYGPTRRREILPYDLASDMSDVTHSHMHSKQACHEYCYLTWLILDNLSKNNLGGIMRDGGTQQTSVGRRVGGMLSDRLLFPVDPGAWPARGTAEFSLYVATWCFRNSDSFEEGIEKAIRVGGDTDTYAAIVGGLLGAHFGYEAIPMEWRDTILGHDVMVEYAEKLYEMSQPE